MNSWQSHHFMMRFFSLSYCSSFYQPASQRLATMATTKPLAMRKLWDSTPFLLKPHPHRATVFRC